MDLFIFSKTLINIVYQIKLIFCYFDKEIYQYIYKIISKRSTLQCLGFNKIKQIRRSYYHVYTLKYCISYVNICLISLFAHKRINKQLIKKVTVLAFC